jgi:single-strand DNA-binding protein
VNDIWVGVAGNVATTPKTAVTANGHTVTSFRLASSVRRQDKGTGEWHDEPPSYVTVVCWRRLAQNVTVSVKLGQPLVVYGRLKVRDWERDGRKGTTVEVEASAVGHDLSRGTSVWSPFKPGAATETGADPVASGLADEVSLEPVAAPGAEPGAAEAA